MLNRWDRTSRLEGDGNGGPVHPDAPAKDGRRGRDVLALISLVLALAGLWAAIFFLSTRSWGEHRPAEAELQEPPPPPTIVIPALTLDAARQIVECAEAGGGDPHDSR